MTQIYATCMAFRSKRVLLREEEKHFLAPKNCVFSLLNIVTLWGRPLLSLSLFLSLSLSFARNEKKAPNFFCLKNDFPLRSLSGVTTAVHSGLCGYFQVINIIFFNKIRKTSKSSAFWFITPVSTHPSYIKISCNFNFYVKLQHITPEK